jgi:hypothetical protein
MILHRNLPGSISSPHRTSRQADAALMQRQVPAVKGSDLMQVNGRCWVVIGVPWRLRHPWRLTVLAIATETQTVAFYVLRATAAWLVGNGRVTQAINQTLVTSGTISTAAARVPGPWDDMKPHFHVAPTY